MADERGSIERYPLYSVVDEETWEIGELEMSDGAIVGVEITHERTAGQYSVKTRTIAT